MPWPPSVAPRRIAAPRWARRCRRSGGNRRPAGAGCVATRRPWGIWRWESHGDTMGDIYIYILYIPRGLTGLLLSGFLGRVWTPGAALRKILLFRRAPPSPRLVRQGDSAFFIICIVCSFFPGSFGVVFSQLCNVFCVGPPSPPGALSSLSPLWGCMPLGTYK